MLQTKLLKLLSVLEIDSFVDVRFQPIHRILIDAFGEIVAILGIKVPIVMRLEATEQILLVEVVRHSSDDILDDAIKFLLE